MDETRVPETDPCDGGTRAAVQEHFRRVHEPAFGRPHRLAEPTVSADGSRIAVEGRVYDELKGLPRQCVYLVEAGGLEPLTSADCSARAPRLTADGSTLGFLSDQGEPGRFQFHYLRFEPATGAAGDPVAAAQVPGTIEYCAWSPDGTKALLGVAGLGADLSGGQGSGTTQKTTDPVPSWYPHVETGATEESWRSVWIYDLASDSVRRLSDQGLNVWEADWMGNAAVVAVTSTDPDEAAWYSAVLTRIDLDGGTHELATSQVQFGVPAAAPDGSRVAVIQAVCSDRLVVAGDLLVGSPPTGGLEPVDTAGVDVTAIEWIDSDRLGLLGIRGLETVAALYDVRSGEVTELWCSTETSCGERHPSGSWTVDGRAVVIEEGYQQPQQVVILDRQPERLAALANAGIDYLLSVAGSAEPVSWSAPDGMQLQGLLCTPPGDGPFPLVVHIHGGPVWSFRNLWSLAYPWTPLLVSRGYAVLNPNPRGSSGRGQEFARTVFGDMGGDDTQDFTSAVDALSAQGVVDAERVGLMGGSYGGFMSAWLVTQDERWAAAVPTSPVTDWYSQHFTSNIPSFDALFLDGDPETPGDRFHSRSPVLRASKVRTPCLNIAGALDRCTPPTQAQEFHQALLEHGVESTLAIYPQEGHGVRAFPALTDYCARVVDWFDRHMGPSSRS